MSNDANSTYILRLRANVASAGIIVKENGNLVPHQTGIFDFATAQINSFQTVAFHIENDGNITLDLTGFQLDGTDASLFTTSSWGGTTISTTNNRSFEVSFNPNSVGLKTAFITVKNTSFDTPNYYFKVQIFNDWFPKINGKRWLNRQYDDRYDFG